MKKEIEKKQSENATIEINKNFFCAYCKSIKDYKEDLCENCYTKEKGYFLGFEIGNCPIFDWDFSAQQIVDEVEYTLEDQVDLNITRILK